MFPRLRPGFSRDPRAPGALRSRTVEEAVVAEVSRRPCPDGQLQERAHGPAAAAAGGAVDGLLRLLAHWRIENVAPRKRWKMGSSRAWRGLRLAKMAQARADERDVTNLDAARLALTLHPPSARAAALLRPRRAAKGGKSGPQPMTFSQFFVMSPRGDTIISRDCTSSDAAPRPPRRRPAARAHRHRPAVRGDCPRGTSEVFFRRHKFWKGDAPPIFVRGRAARPARPRPARPASEDYLALVARGSIGGARPGSRRPPRPA